MFNPVYIRRWVFGLYFMILVFEIVKSPFWPILGSRLKINFLAFVEFFFLNVQKNREMM